jgi:hypothetical protein
MLQGESEVPLADDIGVHELQLDVHASSGSTAETVL